MCGVYAGRLIKEYEWDEAIKDVSIQRAFIVWLHNPDPLHALTTKFLIHNTYT